MEASKAIDSALAKNPKDALAQRYLGETRGLRARLLARHGQDGAEDFAAVRFFPLVCGLSGAKMSWRYLQVLSTT